MYPVALRSPEELHLPGQRACNRCSTAVMVCKLCRLSNHVLVSFSPWRCAGLGGRGPMVACCRAHPCPVPSLLTQPLGWLIHVGMRMRPRRGARAAQGCCWGCAASSSSSFSSLHIHRCRNNRGHYSYHGDSDSGRDASFLTQTALFHLLCFSKPLSFCMRRQM